MKRQEYEQKIAEFDALINKLKIDMDSKKESYEKSKGNVFSEISKREKLELYARKQVLKECYDCERCYMHDSPYENECSLGYELGTKCNHYYELPF